MGAFWSYFLDFFGLAWVIGVTQERGVAAAELTPGAPVRPATRVSS